MSSTPRCARCAASTRLGDLGNLDERGHRLRLSFGSHALVLRSIPAVPPAERDTRDLDPRPSVARVAGAPTSRSAGSNRGLPVREEVPIERRQ
jgi:hypothetical protein